MAGNHPNSSNTSVPALISRRPTVLAPPSLSTVNHLEGAISSVHRHASQSSDRPSQDRRNANPSRTLPLSHRTGFQQAVSQATAAVPVSTRENISTSKTWSSGLARKNTNYPAASTSLTHHEFAVHPSFRSDADNRGDVLVRVEGVDFFVHKHILLFSSPFFTSILQGDWKESRLSQLQRDEDMHGSEEGLPEEDEGPKHSQTEVQEVTDAVLADRLAKVKAEDIETELRLSEPITGGDDTHDMPPRQAHNSVAQTPIDSRVQNTGDSENDAEHPKDEERRRSVLRASYHCAISSQDDEYRGPPPMQENANVNADASEEATPSEDAAGGIPAEETASDSDSFQDEDSDTERAEATASCAGKVGSSPVGRQPSPSKDTQRRRSAVGMRQVRSKSKHLAARLTLRKLEASHKGQSIPTRSTSKTAMLTGEPTVASSKASVQAGAASHMHSHSSPALGPLERLETLATPPLSRRPSAEFIRQRAASEGGAFTTSKTTTEVDTERSRVRKLASRYKDVVAVIDLEEEAAGTFHDFLFHVYPHLDLSVTWWNCGPLLRFSDKFQVPYLRRSCVTFLRASLAGRPIEAMHLAELHSLDDLYKEASRHVLDNFAAWEADELECLSKETLLKLERKRTWFLERLLKLGLANPAWDYECHANCPDPQNCARLLHEKWQAAYASALKWGPPQPSVIFRQLRDLDGASFLPLSACQGTARIWVQLLFDRMFGLGALHAERMFLSVKLNGN